MAEVMSRLQEVETGSTVERTAVLDFATRPEHLAPDIHRLFKPMLLALPQGNLHRMHSTGCLWPF